jgi:hypothetical protein
MKKAYSFITATLLFSVLMQFAISGYTAYYGIEQPYDDMPFLFWLNLFVNIAFVSSLCGFFVYVGIIISDYVNNYESPKDRVKMYHSEAEISWTEIERDDEGEEISRERFGLRFVHNMSRYDNDQALSNVVQVWHNWRSANDCREKRSVQDFCEFVNVHTMYKAAPTKEEFINLLKHH